MSISEEKIQYEIVSYVRNNFCLNHHNPKWLIFSVPNDGKNVMEQMRKKATGLLTGASDLILITPNKITFIEVKTDTGVQSDAQKRFEKDVKALGFEYILVRSLSDVQAYLVKIVNKH